MKGYQAVFSIGLFALCICAANAEVVNFKNCPGEAKCTFNEVAISPCPEAAEGRTCTVYRGSNISITFDFTPEFNANVLTADVSWTQPAFDLPFIGMDTEACKHTACPAQSGKRQTYVYELPIKKSYPPKHYDVKWKLTSENNDTCCMIVQINITKKTKHT
ncbi:ecdysteroid-regulated 16 kDa protein-like [Anopheles nili]|uniref:ecdysteroid-regulated 16 kDa protein-like n=1 Tax=Anopheles nili TaxID=185578 RepID=UPI00237BE966|nr:ecdysteroid-regulated 16 kDa protein-like [Anopheles nili]